MPRFCEDLAFGLAGEEFAKPHIEAFLGFPIVLAQGTYTLDIRRASDNAFIGEIKSRKVGLHTYSTIIIGKNKIDAFTDPERQYYCFFNLTDGLYAVPYDREVFESYSVEDFQRLQTRSDYVDRVHKVYHIPTTDLQLICAK